MLVILYTVLGMLFWDMEGYCYRNKMQRWFLLQFLFICADSSTIALPFKLATSSFWSTVIVLVGTAFIQNSWITVVVCNFSWPTNSYHLLLFFFIYIFIIIFFMSAPCIFKYISVPIVCTSTNMQNCIKYLLEWIYRHFASTPSLK